MKISYPTKLNFLSLKPNHGSKVIWVFSSGLKLTVSLSLLGAAGVVLVIKLRQSLDFSSSNQLSAPKVWTAPGLQNLGNNCFLNVILQALASGSSFRKYLWMMMEEFESSSVEEGDENIPLVSSLTMLVEELCTLRHRSMVLSPRRVMLAIDHYVPNFNLTRQQDAEEAFSHLISSLREEITERFVPNKSNLAYFLESPNVRIVVPKSNEEESEWEKWRRVFLGPFDGILGSTLVCQSCSFQISLDFELFHSLHISPRTSSDGAIMAGCTLENCFKQYFVAEHLKNYCCSNCWHTAAIEYLSRFTQDKTEIEKLQCCNKNDSCDCKYLSSLEGFRWSNSFSRTFKQLSIARSPKILCVHLQRASYNMFGQSVKLLGHISFPWILDVSSFMNTEVGIKKNRGSRERASYSLSMYQNVLHDPELPCRKVSTAESISSKENLEGLQEANTDIIPSGPCLEASETEPSLLDSRIRADKEVISVPFRHQRYRLVSVVEHFGNSGSGHYTVYRRVAGKISDEDSDSLLESAIEQWFCISDSQVESVSEKEVYNANASMLFYERID